MIRRPRTPKGEIKYPGVYQRCNDDCPDPCKRHTWSYAVELPSRNGKRQQHTQAGFSSAKAAATARAELIAKHRSGGLADDQRLTVGAWCDRRLAARETDTDDPLRATTLYGYRSHVIRIKDKIGHIRLRDLRREHISRMLVEIAEDRDRERAAAIAKNEKWAAANPKSRVRPYAVPRSVGRATLTRIRATLSSLLGDAVDEGMLERNPAVLARVRKGKKRTTDNRPTPKA